MSLLHNELAKIDFKAIVNSSLSDATLAERIDLSARKTAIWVTQISAAEPANPAGAFLAEIASLSQQAPALACCGYYKSSVSAARSIVESALYYTFFRCHPHELATLLREDAYYVSKGDILDFHRLHTVNFNNHQARLNLIPDLERWYKKVSAVTHSQIPGTLSGGINLSDIKFNAPLLAESMELIFTAWDVVEALFFSTVSQDLWKLFSPDAKDLLVKGMAADTRAALGLDKK